MKNILITGSSGFLGEELVNYFSDENKIYALVVKNNKKEITGILRMHDIIEAKII